ncbi:NAD(P)-dependent oxidoreductase [Desmospora activa]|uniref:3-hydroxyisobutyrate dehydrogenase-like beta-hydroxyacid dehydrogenase n=1 Tax=Desmospora activa DSM 45169 TaxID=1121389 RepID=A0A2T4Z429_9BACL|nr:NAD(P)-binding domain-containing protein [Desmospora activa]PTM56661.1 3-hydroxyisobutyrate dehydrogenase-like beta-hydroxyacid dehydrogenase [Desmospora activa DSM 45169]
MSNQSVRDATNMKGNNRTPVTIIGLGPMGQALAGSFLHQGHPTTVWNRTAGKADDLVAKGAVQAETVTDAVEASRLVIICVLDYDVVHTILDPVSDTLKGRTLVNLTNGSPEGAREMATWSAERGVDYLDGAIMTPTTTIGTPSAVVLYSGSATVYETYQPTLASTGGSATHLGTDPGRAAAYDLALLDLFWTSMSGYIHALTLARTENIKAKDLAPFAKGIVDILPDIMDEFAHQVDSGHYPGDKSNLISAAAGMEHIIQTAQAHGIDTSVLNAAKAVAQRAIDTGHGTDDFSYLTEVFQKPSP